MSLYVPPHRRQAAASSSEGLSSTCSVAFQQEAWRALSRSITGVVNKVSKDNLEQSAIELFRENLVRGRGLFARSIMRTQQIDSELTPVLAALVSRINKDLPMVVELLCKRLVVQWNRAYLRKDWRYVENASRYLGWLFLLHVVEVDVIYQLLLKHLMAEKRSDEDIDQAAKLFRETFRVMSLKERRSFHEQILTPFRDLLAMDDEELRLSTRSQAVLESCLKEVQEWERRKEKEEPIPEHLVLFDLEVQQTHEMDLDEKYPTEDALDRYTFDPEYDTHEEQYEAVRKTILGEDWEMELLQQVADAEVDEDAEGSDQGADEGADNPSAEAGAAASGAASSPTTLELDASKTLMDSEERKLRREVYLAMRSSIRADEAVHKILRQMEPQTERTICFMVIEGCCEERAYRKMYSMAAERLCKSNSRFQAFFVEAFHARYESASGLTLKQIEYTCKVYSHLLRTGSVYWSRCLSCLDIVENNESQRLMIQYLFKGVAEEIGMPEVLERFQKDEELRWHTQRLFPLHQGVETLKAAVNLYVAMGLAEMTTPLRAALEEERAAHKRARVGH
ncbi:MA3 domain containing protein, putative [Leishmania lindenbergi]|uniref:MA3 domain containing protein n=1 Tax=Leishmania lindenbergi TaxID=651832 RepID=A0AAW2ZUX8_9TRYP